MTQRTDDNPAKFKKLVTLRREVVQLDQTDQDLSLIKI